MTESNDFYSTLQRLLPFFEKNRFNLVTGSFLLFIFMAVRGYLEFGFFNRDPLTGRIFLHTYNVFAAALATYLAFLAGTFILVHFSKVKPRKVANTVLIGMAFLVLGPLIDRFIFGRTEGYEFIWVGDVRGAGIGLIVQLMIICFMGALYVVVRTESPKHFFFTFLSLFSIMAGIGVLPYAIYNGLFPYFGDDATQAAAAILVSVFLVIFAAILLKLGDEKVYDSLRKNMRPFSTLYFILVALIGIGAAGRMLFAFNEDALVTLIVDHVPFALLVFASVAFAAQSGFMLNDIYSLESSSERNPLKSGVLTKSRYRQLALVMAGLAAAFSITLGTLPVVLTLILMGLALANGVFPIQSAKRFAAPLISGAQSFVTFFIGYFTTHQLKSHMIGEFEVEYPTLASYTVPFSVILVSVLIFVLGAVLLSKSVSFKTRSTAKADTRG
ncbi:MAG: hypothetical protein JSW28_09925 [Thermoplasmata archaeon]|nr:MAG: hypothetical protein JSW28_09925 [Thermoplasmata archaeon]